MQRSWLLALTGAALSLLMQSPSAGAAALVSDVSFDPNPAKRGDSVIASVTVPMTRSGAASEGAAGGKVTGATSSPEPDQPTTGGADAGPASGGGVGGAARPEPDQPAIGGADAGPASGGGVGGAARPEPDQPATGGADAGPASGGGVGGAARPEPDQPAIGGADAGPASGGGVGGAARPEPDQPAIGGADAGPASGGGVGGAARPEPDQPAIGGPDAGPAFLLAACGLSWDGESMPTQCEDLGAGELQATFIVPGTRTPGPTTSPGPSLASPFGVHWSWWCRGHCPLHPGAPQSSS